MSEQTSKKGKSGKAMTNWRSKRNARNQSRLRGRQLWPPEEIIGCPFGRNPPSFISFPTHTYAAPTETALTSRRFLSPTKKDSFIQLPTLDCALSRLVPVAPIW